LLIFRFPGGLRFGSRRNRSLGLRGKFFRVRLFYSAAAKNFYPYRGSAPGVHFDVVGGGFGYVDKAVGGLHNTVVNGNDYLFVVL
jgi:hypothetical protein